MSEPAKVLDAVTGVASAVADAVNDTRRAIGETKSFVTEIRGVVPPERQPAKASQVLKIDAPTTPEALARQQYQGQDITLPEVVADYKRRLGAVVSERDVAKSAYDPRTTADKIVEEEPELRLKREACLPRATLDDRNFRTAASDLRSMRKEREDLEARMVAELPPKVVSEKTLNERQRGEVEGLKKFQQADRAAFEKTMAERRKELDSGFKADKESIDRSTKFLSAERAAADRALDAKKRAEYARLENIERQFKLDQETARRELELRHARTLGQRAEAVKAREQAIKDIRNFQREALRTDEKVTDGAAFMSRVRNNILRDGAREAGHSIEVEALDKREGDIESQNKADQDYRRYAQDKLEKMLRT